MAYFMNAALAFSRRHEGRRFAHTRAGKTASLFGVGGTHGSFVRAGEFGSPLMVAITGDAFNLFRRWSILTDARPPKTAV